MALADDVRSLTARTLTALDASHDYYTYSKRVWRLLQQVVKEGRQFTFRNLATGSRVDQTELLGQSQVFITEYLTSFTFQHFVLLFEEFFFELLRCWLTVHPGRLSRKQVEMATILNAPDKNAVIVSVVDRELNELKYKRLSD